MDIVNNTNGVGAPIELVNDFETCLDRKSKTPYNVIYDIKKKYRDLFLIEVESLSKAAISSHSHRHSVEASDENMLESSGLSKEGGGKKKIIKANVIVF